MWNPITSIRKRLPTVRPSKRKASRSGGGTEDNNSYIVVVHGDNTDATWYEADEDLDDQAIEYTDSDGNDHTHGLTTKPITIDGYRIYFTRPGFKGTCAIAEDTLLASDEYIPPTDSDDERQQLNLWGSSKTVSQMTKGRLLRKLMTPSKESLTMTLMKLGAGAFLGFMLAQYLAGK